MKFPILHFPSLRLLSMCIFALLCLSSVGYASPQPSAENNVHFCLPLNLEDMRARDSIYAATKHALNLNVGAPRMVRMIYFLPNDRPFRQEVVDSMKVVILQIQTFYAEQMQAHGHGNKTFRFETDAQGDPLVHRMDGQHPDSHYLDNTSLTVLDEVEQVFDVRKNVYFIVIDNSIDAIGTRGQRLGGIGGDIGKNGGYALVHGDLASTQRHMNLDMASDCRMISEMMPTLCLMAVVNDTLYLRAMPNFWLCIPISIPVLKLKKNRHQQSNSFRRLSIQPIQRASLFNSKSAIQMDFTK